jgi:hypothetical protein
MSQTNESEAKRAWNEDRLRQSRLANLAKAREVKLAKNKENAQGFTSSPIVRHAPQATHASPHLAVEEDEVITADNGDVAMLLPQSNHIIEGLATLGFALFAAAVPSLTNAAIDVLYPTIRDYFFKTPESPRRLQTVEENDRWHGQSIFHK